MTAHYPVDIQFPGNQLRISNSSMFSNTFTSYHLKFKCMIMIAELQSVFLAHSCII
jgi:hypothetical protein